MLQEIKISLAEKLSKATGFDAEKIIQLLEKPKNENHGDISFPCFQLAKLKNMPPAEFASKIKAELELPIEITEVNQIGPFLNFSINYEAISGKVLNGVIAQTPKAPIEKTIIVEYSSPNIAKPFHVGHLRATLIGNCLDRLYRFIGFNVESINHLGDWGTQFGFVYAGCKLWGEPEIFSVASLVELYKKATFLKEEEEKKGSIDENSVTNIARDYFIRLESGESEAIKFWERCVEVSLDYLKKTYLRLDVSFDHYLGESFYSDKLDQVRRDLETNCLLKESQGAFGVDLGEELGFARILTPDGRSLYLTRDIAAVDYRYGRFNFDKSIYVVGAPQSLHFKQLKEILKLSKKNYSEKIVHLAFGHVLGMKTRGDGQTIELNDFLDEANSRALSAYQKEVLKRPENINEILVSEKVALAAVIFSTLNRNNIKDVHFNWDEALSFQGDSGPYLLYAHARLCGVEEKAKSAGFCPATTLNYNAIDLPTAKPLVLKLIEFENVLNDAIQLNEPILLCSYALELSKNISKAYMDLKVIGTEKEIGESRLLLFKAARIRLGEVLKLIGITPIERM